MPTLQRSGARPLTFKGDVIAEASSLRHDGYCSNRSWDLTLYQAGERYVLHIVYHTKWETEEERTHATVADTIEQVEDELRMYFASFEDDVIGFPPGRQYDEKRQMMEKSLRHCLDSAISELLAEFPEEV